MSSKEGTRFSVVGWDCSVALVIDGASVSESPLPFRLFLRVVPRSGVERLGAGTFSFLRLLLCDSDMLSR